MRMFKADGTVNVAEKQGKPQKVKDVRKKNEEMKICLNCKKKKCNGYCEKFKEEKNNEN